MKRKIFAIVTFMLAFTVMLLSGVKTEAAGTVKLDKTKVVVEIGNTEKLNVLNTTAKVKWSTSNKKVVKVKDGVLTPVKIGTAKVTAKVGRKKYICKVVVADYSGMSVEQTEVVSYALQFVGNRYVYGGSSLTQGTDCSGFTMSVYKNFGYKLPHNAQAQIGKTKKVKFKDLKPGDLIFYGYGKYSCSHVAMYIGNKKVVHASNEITGIVISDYRYRNTVGAGRVLKKETYQNTNNSDGLENTADNVTRLADSE